MNQKKRRLFLNHPLEAILSKESFAVREGPLANLYIQVSVDLLVPNRYQPRQHFSEKNLLDLSVSIKNQGILQPLVVRKTEHHYEILAGERRWRAAKMAGLLEVPVRIVQADEKAAMAIALVENLQREALNPIEEAEGLHHLMDEFKLTHEEVSRIIGHSRSHITNMLRILTLENHVKKWIKENLLSLGHAKILLGLKPEKQIKAAKLILKHGLSVRETEKWVQLHAEAKKKPGQEEKTFIPERLAWEEAIQGLDERLPKEIQIRTLLKGKPKIIFSADSLKNLSWLIDHLKF